ncbi:MAG TPA: CocE/NonD family hydrolase [Acidimicrobiales bacterium]|nr:CocE/NonD family hydrolase [Acidimicrobiales bacterium]
MSDGTRLSADLYMPKGLPMGERIPALISQTIYGRGLEFRTRLFERLARRLMPGVIDIGEDMARYGYATVVVDLRGSGASFGNKRAHLMPDAVADGAQVIDWIVAQPWSNGRVGATGISALGMAAMWLATSGHPALKAAAPRFSIFDIFAGTHPGGLLLKNLVGDVGARLRALDQNRVHEGGGAPVTNALIRLLVRGNRPVDADRDRSLLAHAVAARGDNEYFDETIASSRYRDDGPVADGMPLLDALSPATHVDAIAGAGVPVYTVAGWADSAFTREMANMFATLSPRVPGCRLTIGPWDHGAARLRSPMQDKSRAPDFDFAADLVRFFDLHLRDRDWGLADEAPVHYFTHVEERWHEADSWPPRAMPQVLYAGDGCLLVREPPAGAGADRLVVAGDAGAGRHSRYASPGLGRAATEEPVEATPPGSSLLYRSDAFGEDTEVTGHPSVTLFVGCDRDDAALFAYLEDEGPDGARRHVTEGFLLLSLREVHADAPYTQAGPWRPMRRADEEPMKPDAVEEITLDLLPASWLFATGHRAVLRVVGADPANFVTPLEPAPTLTLHRGVDRPSRLVLPVVERS